MQIRGRFLKCEKNYIIYQYYFFFNCVKKYPKKENVEQSSFTDNGKEYVWFTKTINILEKKIDNICIS